jgi:phenol/toluene 2-monooxygenase (NADH) P1/A1
MQIDLRTVTLEPLRHAYDHLEARFGAKPASRYQEGSYDLQAVENLHYRPTWDPDQALYDATLSRVRMRDWYTIKDPRQFYYSSYTLARARQQDTAESNFGFVETRGLADLLPQDLRELALALLVPLRHAAWGANQNNTLICAYGYGTTFTQPCMFQAMDQLGIAQYLSRLGLLLGGTESLDAGKRAWMESPTWQPLRRYVEDVMALRDPIEVFTAQNVVLDGLLMPLVYERLVDDVLSSRGASCVAMLTQFMSEWGGETRKWIDAVVKTLATESAENRAAFGDWIDRWQPRAVEAVAPLVALVLGADAGEAVEAQVSELSKRLAKAGLPR